MDLEVIRGTTVGAGPMISDSDTAILDVLDGVVVTGPPTPSRGLDPDKLIGYWEAAKKLDQAGLYSGASLDFDGLIQAAIAGGAAGAGLAGVGAVAGAIVAAGIYIIAFFTGNRPSRWDDAGPGVHYWFTNYGPQEYLNYLDETGNTGVFRSVADCVRGLLTFWLTKYNYVLRPGNHRFYGDRLDMDYTWDATQVEELGPRIDWARQFYASFGVDWDATIALWDGGGRAQTLMMINQRFLSDTEGEDGGDASPSEGGSAGVAIAVGAAAVVAVALLSSANSSNRR